ncbi:hypothetical protein Salat_1117700, partial [Sesamum alatum]
ARGWRRARARPRTHSYCSIGLDDTYLKAFQEANKKHARNPADPQYTRWIPSSTGKVKINFDGALFKVPAGAGAGMVARDHNGFCVAWNYQFIPHILDAEHAEALALRMLVEIAIARGWKDVVLEGDCWTLVKKIKEDSNDISYIGPIVQETKVLLRRFSMWNIRWIARDNNKAAHNLAHLACSWQIQQPFLPVNVISAIQVDLYST